MTIRCVALFLTLLLVPSLAPAVPVAEWPLQVGMSPRSASEIERDSAFLDAVRHASDVLGTALQAWRHGPRSAERASVVDLILVEQALLRFPPSLLRNRLLMNVDEALRALVR